MDSKLLAAGAFVIVIVVGLALRWKAAPPPDLDDAPEVVASTAAPPPASPASAPPVASRPPAPTAVAPNINVQVPPPPTGGGGFVVQPIDPKSVETRAVALTGPEAFAALRERQQAAAAAFRARHAKHGDLIANAKPGITSEEVRKRDASFEAVRKKERTFDMLPAAEQEAVRGKMRSLATDIQATPQDASLYGKLATLQREAKLEMMALDTLERGLAKAPGDLALMRARAKVLADYGFGQKAAAAYEAILKLKPDDKEAKAALETVRKVYLPPGK